MANFSTYLENIILNNVLKNSATWPSITNVYVALYVDATNNEMEALTATEVANSNNYARTAATFGTVTDGSVANSADVDFPQATGSWGNITHCAIYDTATHNSGNQLFWGELTSAKIIGVDDYFSFTSGNLNVTLT